MRRRDFAAGVLPSLTIMGALLVLPLAYTLVWSFQDVAYGTPGQWEDFANYVDALTDPRFHTSVAFTVGFALVNTAVLLVLGYALALMLNRVSRGSSVFLGFLLVPFVLPAVIAATAYSQMFDDSFGGLVNYVIETLGGQPVAWFTSTWPNRLMILSEAVWAATPFVMLVLLGSLKGVPDELREAARMDGANWWQRQRFVIVPTLGPTFRFLAMILTMGGLGIFDSLIPLAPNAETVGTQSVSLYVFQNAFALDQQDLGLGSAVNILMLIVLVALTSPFVRRMYNEVKEGA